MNFSLLLNGRRCRPEYTGWLVQLKQLPAGEEGGAYTLSYVMVIPILMLLTCVVVETTLMMSSKLGTTYAAFSAARAASVWSSASRDWNAAEERINRAAIRSFAPFASSSVLPGTEAGTSAEDAYVESYQAFVDSPVAAAAIRRKYRNAARLVTVTTDGPPSRWDSEITVTVQYKFPFQVPGIGRLLGTRGDDGQYYVSLESEATMRNDGPQNESQSLGIGYGTLD